MQARSRVGILLVAVAPACGDVPAGVDGVARDRAPNIVVLLADDLGWGDVGYHGGDVPTPHIDRLVASGVELDRFYTAPVCSPTRAGLLTGRYPVRFGMQRNVTHPWDDLGLPAGERTLAELLGEAGYARRALVGKWHLGWGQPERHPLEHGFTEFYGFHSGAVDYFTHRSYGELDWHRGREPVREEGYATDLLADEAVRFLRRAAGAEPFLLYLAWGAPHAPYQSPAGAVGREAYGAMVASLDAGIGRVLGALDELGLGEDTIVWFASDNGANPVGSNAPLRGVKKSVYDGALRVPAAVVWAGTLAPRRLEERVDYIDVLPTLLGLGDVAAAPPLELDGLDLAAVLRGEAPAPARPLHTIYEDRRQRWDAVIEGRRKLVRARTKKTSVVELALYDLFDDPTEQRDLAGAHAADVARLTGMLDAFAARGREPAVSLRMEAPRGWRPTREWRVE